MVSYRYLIQVLAKSSQASLSKKKNNFFEDLKGSEHIILLYYDKLNREKIQRAFLTSDFKDDPRIYFSHNSKKIPNVVNFIYEGFLGDSQALVKMWNEHIKTVHSQNKSPFPTRIADEDCSWWLKDFLNETIEYEKQSGKRLDPHMTALCSYDINILSQYSEKIISDIVSWHGYVIVDNPFAIYKNKEII